MNVLLLRLIGPIQSWGTQSRFTERDTGLEPSKSGVLGLICAALGMKRSESVEDLALLRMGVRIDHEGKMSRDFQITQDVIKANGAKGKDAVVSHRYYLTDADFLVGLEGHDLVLLRRIETALMNPVWPLFLGRKAFPPSLPVYLKDGLKTNTTLYNALKAYPRCPRSADDSYVKIRLVLEDNNGESVRIDQPQFSFEERKYLPRHVTTCFIPLAEIPVAKEELCISLY